MQHIVRRSCMPSLCKDAVIFVPRLCAAASRACAVCISSCMHCQCSCCVGAQRHATTVPLLCASARHVRVCAVCRVATKMGTTRMHSQLGVIAALFSRSPALDTCLCVQVFIAFGCSSGWLSPNDFKLG